MEKRIVFFDIDGTLQGWDKVIPQDAADAVRALRRRGHLAVINTGRPGSHVEPGIRAIGFDGYVCAAGGHIERDGRVIRHCGADAELSRRIVELVRSFGLCPIYESEEGMFYDRTMPQVPYAVREREYFRARGFDVDYDIDTPGFRFDKFVAFSTPGGDYRGFCERVTEWFDMVDRVSDMSEFVMKGCSKEIGVRLFCESCGIDPADCLAIGDGVNDIPMFRAVGHPVVMGDGNPEVFPLAEYITLPLHEGGVANALRHYGLID